ncbi:electron transport complex subunit RsxG [Arhodomonas sp. SL1]|uniref:electron transport complex subunit RsxG n=1 Tax=Arhodomonas sp. SL1 TaxID=3425691 RepID=UPI003F8842E6
MSDHPARASLVAAIVLATCAATGAVLLALTHRVTDPAIEANREAAVRHRLADVLPEGPFDRPVTRDTLTVRAPDALGTDEALTVYRAYRDGEPVAAVLTAVAPDGYNGAIRLLIGIRAEGSLVGVRVIEHGETPGLGDLIEAEKSDWLEQFRGRRLGDPPQGQWTVARGGGAFDQITGATITPRAVVHAVRRALVYFEAHREELFARGGKHTADSRAVRAPTPAHPGRRSLPAGESSPARRKGDRS